MNILAIGARLVSVDDSKEAIKLWLELPDPEVERHIRRVHKIG